MDSNDAGSGRSFAGAKRTVSRTDVARRCGVSRQTVSNVINNSAPVSPAVRTRVLAAIREMGYHPNPIARSLATNSTGQVAVLVEHLNNPYFGEVVMSVTRHLLRAKLRPLILHGEWIGPEGLAEMYQGLVDAVAIIDGDSRISATSARELLDRGIPVVGSSFARELGVPTIDPDYEDGMRQVLEHLTRLGHRRVGFFVSRRPGREDDRLTAFRRLAGQFGLVLQDRAIIQDTTAPAWSLAAGHEGARRFLDNLTGATALICVGDLHAMGALRAFQQRGTRVPEDISLVGWDDIPMAAYLNPPLTSVHVDADEIGMRIVQGVVAAIRRQPVMDSLVRCRLVTRQSTGPAPIDAKQMVAR